MTKIPPAFTKPTFTHGNTRISIIREQDKENLESPWEQWEQATGLADWHHKYSVVPKRFNKTTKERKPICGCFNNKSDVMLWVGESINEGELFLVVGFNFVGDDEIKLDAPIEITSEQYDAFNRSDDNFDIDNVFGHCDGVIFINAQDYRKRVDKNKRPITFSNLIDVINADFKTLQAYVSGEVYGFKVESNMPITIDQYYKILDVVGVKGKEPIGESKYKQVCDIIGYDTWEEVHSCYRFFKEGTDEELYRNMASHWEDTSDIIEIKRQLGITS